MLALGSLAFASPWLLAALAALPVIWWLLRVTPPAPRRIAFPAIRLLLGLTPREETPARTPWWLILLRTVLAALVIVALAHPLLNPQAHLAGSGPLALVIDDGWTAARDWSRRQGAAIDLLAEAEREATRLVAAGELAAKDVAVAVRSVPASPPRPVTVRASGEDGALLAREAATIAPGDSSVSVRLSLPTELRNRIARIEIEGEESAGGVLLVDERWRRRPVGIATAPNTAGQPLLSENYYLERALGPFTEVRRGRAADLLKRE